MAEITKEKIEKIARLAMIEIDPKNQEKLCNQISNILDWVDKLNEIDTTNIEPLTTVCDHNLITNNDIVNDGNIVDDILRNTKDAKYGYFSVPKVIE